MKVLFIYPSIDCPPGINHGLAAMSGVLKANGHDVELIHVCDKIWPIPENKELLETIRAMAPGVIGFSCMSQQYPWSCELARDIKKVMDIPLVVGGVHVTMVPDDVTNDGIWDFVMPGEADFSFLELVNRLDSDGDVLTTPGCRMVRDGKLINNPLLPFPDLNELPPKDYDLFDIETIVDKKNGWMGMITSRGCPYKCTYCFNREIVDLYMDEGAAKKSREFLRFYDTDRILDEIKMLKEKFPRINTLIIDDDLFTLSKPYVMSFTKQYKESGIELPFVVNAHVNRFDREMAGALHDGGCMIVKFGLESGSQKIRKEVLYRIMSNEAMEASFAAAHEYDLHTSAFIMFGLPHEGRAEIMETLTLCGKIQMGRFRWALFYPFPGTAGYTIAKSADLIDFDKMNNLGNYFDGTCLKFDDEHNLFLDKLKDLCTWYVNALTDWPCAPIYQRLVKELEGLNRREWQANRQKYLDYDKELTADLMAKDITHYAIRYAHVMGVRSDFIKWDEERLKKTDEWLVTYTLD